MIGKKRNKFINHNSLRYILQLIKVSQMMKSKASLKIEGKGAKAFAG